MFSAALTEILCCPDTFQHLAVASPELVENLNGRIYGSKIKNRAGEILTRQIEGGLIRADGKLLYPVHKGIPIMLSDEGISL